MVETLINLVKEYSSTYLFLRGVQDKISGFNIINLEQILVGEPKLNCNLVRIIVNVDSTGTITGMKLKKSLIKKSLRSLLATWSI